MYAYPDTRSSNRAQRNTPPSRRKCISGDESTCQTFAIRLLSAYNQLVINLTTYHRASDIRNIFRTFRQHMFITIYQRTVFRTICHHVQNCGMWGQADDFWTNNIGFGCVSGLVVCQNWLVRGWT
jgi:hypothetical protein